MDALELQAIAHRLARRRVPVLPALLRRGIQVLFSSVLPPELVVGAGTRLGYGGLGVVIHGDTVIGRNCLIAQHVTIGGRSGLVGAPRIGNGVLIAPGAKVLGPIAIGDYAIIGANAVVLSDVPPGEIVGGVPAKPIHAQGERTRAAFRRDMELHFGVELPITGRLERSRYAVRELPVDPRAVDPRVEAAD